MTLYKRNKTGFTIVELTIIIVVIGILASISVIGYGSWRTRIAQNEVKSDLLGVSGAMESIRNFGNGYPLMLPSTFTASSNVTVTYANGDLTRYCINGVSKVHSTVIFYIDSSEGKDPKAGTCSDIAALAAPTLTGSLNGGGVNMAWNSVPAAVSYEVQWRQNNGTWTIVSVASTNYSQSNLVVGNTYDYQVRTVKVGGGNSAWSNMKSMVPFAGPSSISSCAAPNGGLQLSWETQPQFTTFYILGDNGEEERIASQGAYGTFTWDLVEGESALSGSSSIDFQYIKGSDDWSTVTTQSLGGVQYPCGNY